MVEQEDQVDDTVPDYSYKMILIGNARVGKTSLINYYMHRQFNENEEKSKVVNIKRKTQLIENTNKIAQLMIWDTLGEEEFKSIAAIFFKKAVGAFLIYDVNDRQSFEELDTWFEQISLNADQRVIIMVLGNKCDEKNREVTYNEGMEYAKSKNFGFLETSAKTGYNVDNAFNCLVRGKINITFVEIYKNQSLEEEEEEEDAEK